MFLAIWEWYVRMVYAKITIRLGNVCSWKNMYSLSRMFINIIFTAWINIVSNYYRLSICCGYIWYDNAHSTAIKMITLRSNFHSLTTPHTPPLRASYGVSFVSYTKNNGRDISIVHCISLRLSSQLYQHWYLSTYNISRSSNISTYYTQHFAKYWCFLKTPMCGSIQVAI